MRTVFVDTGYWVASVNPRDQLHSKAQEAGAQLGPCSLVTSDMILTEVLNMFAEKGVHLRRVAVQTTVAIMSDARVEVVPQTRRLFQDAFDLYRNRLDQSWSLTDCASFVIMKGRGITEALTPDRHFVQNGFMALLRDDAVDLG
jgi:uncharacterized protein